MDASGTANLPSNIAACSIFICADLSRSSVFWHFTFTMDDLTIHERTHDASCLGPSLTAHRLFGSWVGFTALGFFIHGSLSSSTHPCINAQRASGSHNFVYTSATSNSATLARRDQLGLRILTVFIVAPPVVFYSVHPSIVPYPIFFFPRFVSAFLCLPAFHRQSGPRISLSSSPSPNLAFCPYLFPRSSES